jgi:LysM repeat protein
MKSWSLAHMGFGLAGVVLGVDFSAFAQSSAYRGPAYSPPPAYTGKPSPFNTQSKVDTLANQVSRLAANDQKQDVRLNRLEREVSSPGTIEGGMIAAPKTLPYTAYQVRPGDSLWRIASQHRVSPGQIMAFNRMPNDTVVVGQTLMIPAPGSGSAPISNTPATIPGGFHTVREGETYYSIARKHGTTVDALTKANPKVNPNRLGNGMKLALPGKKSAAPPSPPKNVAYDYGLPAPVKPTPPPPAPKSGNGTHTVRSGESLGVIAKKNGIPTAALQKANNLANPNSLRVGQVLVIPGGAGKTQVASNTKKTSAPVKSSSKSGGAYKPAPPGSGTVNAPDYPPSPPAKPVPPTPPSPPASNRGIVAYRMDAGDTIDSVANMFGTTSGEIRRINKLSPTASLKSGDEILVPGMGPVGN